MFFFYLVALFFLPAAESTYSSPLTWPQTMTLIERACPATQYKCPTPKYLGRTTWWDEKALMESDIVEKFRTGELRHHAALNALRAETCCSEGECLAQCQIFEKNEDPAVSGFPENIDEIFALEIPQLKKYKEYISEYAKFLKTADDKFEGRRRHPAEVEDYLDEVFRLRDKIRFLKV